MNLFCAPTITLLIFCIAILCSASTDKSRKKDIVTTTPTVATTSSNLPAPSAFPLDDKSSFDDTALIFLLPSCRVLYFRMNTGNELPILSNKDSDIFSSNDPKFNCTHKRIVAFTSEKDSQKMFLAIMNMDTRPIRFTPLRFQVELATKESRPYYALEGPTSTFFIPYHKKLDITTLMFSTIDGDVGVMFFRDSKYTVCIYPVKRLRHNYIVFERTFAKTLVDLNKADKDQPELYVRSERNGAPAIFYCGSKVLTEMSSVELVDGHKPKNSMFEETALLAMKTKQIRLAQYNISGEVCKELRTGEENGGGHVTLKADLIHHQIIFDNAEPRFMNLRMIKYEARERHVRSGWFMVVIPVVTTSLALMVVFRYLGGDFRGLRPT